MKSTIHLTLLCFALLITSSPVHAQKRANNWVFSNFGIDFNQSPPKVSTDYAMFGPRGTTAMSDENGQLLFYANGLSVWNKNHELMKNGTISNENELDIRECLAVPHPGNSNIYYLFSVFPFYRSPGAGLYYSTIDMSSDNGLGEVVAQKQPLVPAITNKISAIHNLDENFYWVMVREGDSNRYYTYKIDENGLNETPIINEIGRSVTSSFDGQMKFSPDGRRVACGYGTFDSFGNGLDGEGVQLFDFDSQTGQMSNDQLLLFPEDIRPIVGVEFSADATKLYAYQSGSTGEAGLYQFDLTLPTDQIANSRLFIGESTRALGEQFQLAPDGKIYFAKGGGSAESQLFLGAINQPNIRGVDCDFQEFQLPLEGGEAFLYMPNFVQSNFFKTDISNTLPCTGNATVFQPTNTHRLDSVRWYFEGASTSTEVVAQHQFSSTGKYIVQLIAFYPEKTDTIQKAITVRPSSAVDLGVDSTFCSGDKLVIDEKFSKYAWNTGDSLAFIKLEEHGIYTVTVTNELGCESSDTIGVEVIDLPNINLPDTIGFAGSNSLILNPGDFEKYAWSTGDTTPDLTINNAGWYGVVVSDTKGCSANHSVFTYFGEQPPVTIVPKWRKLNPQPSSNTGRSIAFVDDEVGFIVNQKELLKTSDGGLNWIKLQDIRGGNAIAFADQIGYIVGDFGAVYKSTYAGGGWNQLSIPFGGNFNAVTLLSADSLLITGDNVLFKSFDGGLTWDTNAVPNIDIEDSHFINAEIGIVVGKNGRILKTIDGGVSWYDVQVSNPITRDYYQIYFATETLGFATKGFNNLYRTTDAGETWEEIETFFDEIYNMQFLDDQIGYGVGDSGSIHKTTDGGLTWQLAGPQSRIFANDLYGLFFLDENRGFLTGTKGRILSTTNGGKIWNEYAPTYIDINQVQFTSTQIGYARARDHLFKSTDRGQTWTNIGAPIPNQKVRQFDFVSGELGFAVAGGSTVSSASSGFVYKTTDGGMTWTNPIADNQPLIRDDIRCLTFVNERIGFACSAEFYGGLHKTTDGGTTWNSINENFFVEVQFLDEQVGYARKLYTTLYKTTDGGVTWQLSFEAPDDITAFHFVDTEVGYFVGDGGLIYKTIDGGDNWEKLELPYEFYEDILFYTANIGYVLDEEGLLYTTEDGGMTWRVDFQGFGVSSISNFENDFYLGGRFGCIFTNSLSKESLVGINEVEIRETTDSSVMLSLKVFSELDTSTILFDIGTTSTNYDRTITIGTYPMRLNQQIDFTVSDLQPATTYFGRLRIMDESTLWTSEEISFRTDGVTSILTIAGVDVKIFPNPVDQQLTIKLSKLVDDLQYELTNTTGQQLLSGQLTQLQNSLNLAALDAGLYYLTILQKGQLASYKILKR